MGLDSVELVVAFEKHFGIQIPDAEAENMITVGDAVDYVCRHLGIGAEDRRLQDKLLADIFSCLSKRSSVSRPILPADLVSDLLNLENDEERRSLASCLGMQVPVPDRQFTPSPFSRIWRTVGLRPIYDWREITVIRFTDVVWAENTRC